MLLKSWCDKSRGSSQPRDCTQFSHIAGRFFTSWATREAKNTGVGSLSLQQIFLTQELNWGLLHCRRILYKLSCQGSPDSVLFTFWESIFCSLNFSINSSILMCLIIFDWELNNVYGHAEKQFEAVFLQRWFTFAFDRLFFSWYISQNEMACNWASDLMKAICFQFIHSWAKVLLLFNPKLGRFTWPSCPWEAMISNVCF